MKELSKLQNLLTQISAIIKKYEKIAELTGENFNVFRTLNLDSSEVRMHSALLAELLNPQGTHGQHDLFLLLFVEQFGISNFDTKSAYAEVEKHTGFINTEYSEGGRIDILLTDKKGNHIIIENKIYASDQKNQLLRYHNFDKKANLFYLNLYGKEPNDWSTDGKLDKNDFKIISYSSDIIQLLEKCRKETVTLPIIRETITQYINLIKYLTNQTLNNTMKEDIVKTITENDDYLKTLFEIQKTDIVNKVKKQLIVRLKEQMTEIENDLPLKLVFDNELGSRNDGSYFTFYLNNSKKGFYISFGFCTYFNNMFYVVHCDEKYVNEYREIVCKRIGNRANGFNEIWVNWFENNYRYWENSPEPWLAIVNRKLQENIKEKVKTIIQSLEGLNL